MPISKKLEEADNEAEIRAIGFLASVRLEALRTLNPFGLAGLAEAVIIRLRSVLLVPGNSHLDTTAHPLSGPRLRFPRT